MKKQSPKFNQNQKDKMRNLFEKGYAVQYIARKFKCWPNAVWNNVFDLAPAKFLSNAKIDEIYKKSSLIPKDITNIRQLAKKGMGSPTIAELYGIGQSTALSIIRGRTFRWVKGWTRPHGTTWIYLDPVEMPHFRVKTDKTYGPKSGTRHQVEPGILLKLSKKYGVSPSTICKWRKKGKLK